MKPVALPSGLISAFRVALKLPSGPALQGPEAMIGPGGAKARWMTPSFSALYMSPVALAWGARPLGRDLTHAVAEATHGVAGRVVLGDYPHADGHGVPFGGEEVIGGVDRQRTDFFRDRQLFQQVAGRVVLADRAVEGDVEVPAGVDREPSRFTSALRQRQLFDEVT